MGLWGVLVLLGLLWGRGLPFELQEALQELQSENARLHGHIQNLSDALSDLKLLLWDHAQGESRGVWGQGPPQSRDLPTESRELFQDHKHPPQQNKDAPYQLPWVQTPSEINSCGPAPPSMRQVLPHLPPGKHPQIAPPLEIIAPLVLSHPLPSGGGNPIPHPTPLSPTNTIFCPHPILRSKGHADTRWGVTSLSTAQPLGGSHKEGHSRDLG